MWQHVGALSRFLTACAFCVEDVLSLFHRRDFVRPIFFFQIHLDEALDATSHRVGNVKDIASAFKGESRFVSYTRTTPRRTLEFLVCTKQQSLWSFTLYG